MKLLKKIIVAGLAVVTLSAFSVTAFAASSYSNPAEVIAGLTGRDVQSVIAERQTGQTYGSIASKAGVLDNFKTEVLKIKEDTIAARVAAGTMTQEQADATIKATKDRQAICDGTGAGNGMGAGYGPGNGTGNGKGKGGRGMGLRNGSYLYQ